MPTAPMPVGEMPRSSCSVPVEDAVDRVDEMHAIEPLAERAVLDANSLAYALDRALSDRPSRTLETDAGHVDNDNSGAERAL
jgi:hypothetical protein